VPRLRLSVKRLSEWSSGLEGGSSPRDESFVFDGAGGNSLELLGKGDRNVQTGGRSDE